VALKQVNEQPQPPSQRNPAVDPSLESIILKCMQKDPANRFQSASELVRVLHDYLAGRLQAVNNATSVLPANTTQQIGAPTPVQAPVTATMPRVSQGARPVTTRAGQTSATEMARQQQEERERKHRRNVVIGAFLAIALFVGAAFALYTYFTSGTATQKVPNLASYTQEEAIAAIESTEWFEVGDIIEEYSDNVEVGYVLDQDPEAGKAFAQGTRINIYISKGPEPAADVTVPDLSNMTGPEAEAALARANLVSKMGDGIYDPNVEVGHVVAQSPAAGTTVKAGDTITYQLSLGTEEVKVPNVVGMTEGDAWDTLTTDDFAPQVAYESSNSVPEGYVIRQSPTDKAAKGATVTITVSTGSSTVSVPNVVGSSQSGAISALTSAGFDYYVETASSSSVSSGYVISQSPSGGRNATKGSTITIVVSTGPASVDTGGDTTSTDTSGDSSQSTSSE
jgi:serine/threonine-protein kinase